MQGEDFSGRATAFSTNTSSFGSIPNCHPGLISNEQPGVGARSFEESSLTQLPNQQDPSAPSPHSSRDSSIDTKNQNSNLNSQGELLLRLKSIKLDHSLISTRERILHDESIVCIGVDCETNSLRGPMLELAAVNYNTGETWSTLINPGNISFNLTAYKVHNISQEMVQAPGVPTSAEACIQFMAWLYQQSGGEEMVIMGYNAIL